MSAERQMAALLQVVEEYREAHCKEVLAVARAQAARTIAQARATAAHRLRAALAGERERRDGIIAAAAARLGTQRRLLQQRRLAAALKTAWFKFETELLARWDARATRDIWVTQQLAAARTSLLADPRASLPADSRARPSAGEWQVEHPLQWTAEERERAARRFAEYGIDAVRFVARPDVRAGLRIRCGHNVLDATVAGLLADRAIVEGRLLDCLEGDDR